MINIMNREEIVEQLAEMLIQFDKELNSAYQTDVYLYYDEETEIATLDTFVNVGGNSWLDDDHYTIYSDREHYDWFLEILNWSIEEIAIALDMTKEELIKQAAAYLKYGIDEIDTGDIYRFVKNNSEYYDKLLSQYESTVDEHYSDYAERAEEIIDQFLKDINEE